MQNNTLTIVKLNVFTLHFGWQFSLVVTHWSWST